MPTKKDKITETLVKSDHISQEESEINRLIPDKPSLMSYPTERGSVSFTPTKEGAIKSKAYAVMNDQIQMQYDQMERQIKLLALQMKELKDRHDLSVEIYKSKLNFEPVAGQIYYLYQREDDSKLLSILSPDDWGEEKMDKQKLKFLAKVMLLADFTWKIL